MPRRFPIRSATRRRFLQGSTAALAGIALSNCRGNGPSDVQSNDSASSTGSSDGKLYIYTWADYTDDEVVQQFTEATGIEVEIDLYESNEAMLAKMQAGGGDKYSIIYPSDYMVSEMRDLGLLMAMDAARLEGMDALVDNWQSPAYDADNGYSIPYSWGTTGLVYNTTALATPITDWADVWLNAETALDRRITLLDDVRETLGAALKSLGYSVNSTDPGELEAAYRKLLELKPALSAFKSFGWQEELLGGDLLVSHAYSVEAIPLTEADSSFDYIVPDSGAVIWTDTLVIPTSAPNVDAAYQWINFNLQPEVSKGLVERLFIATPNGKAMELLSPEMLDNTDLFPPQDVLARCEALGPVGETGELYDQYWNQLTSA
ncbi:MAG: spermidine/putrescine ABC transporter substrate-binding protein [Cyanobacteria bacterium P01_A01_bin.105]